MAKTETKGPTSLIHGRGIGQPLPTALVEQVTPKPSSQSSSKPKKSMWSSLGKFITGGGGIGEIFGGEGGKASAGARELRGQPPYIPPVVPQSPLAPLMGKTRADILLGRVPLPDIDMSEDNKDWVAFQKTNPGLARAIVDKKNLEYQSLLKQAQQGSSGVGNAVIDPMAVQLLFQNSINPFLSQVLQGANSQTQNYGNLMSQLTSDPNLPAPYRQTLKAQAPQQMANMNQLTTALAGYTATQPSIQSLLSLMNRDYNAQQENIALQRLGQQQALTGQLFQQ